MSKTTRYAMSWGKDEEGYIYVSATEQTNGNWVSYADHALLKARYEVLEAAIISGTAIQPDACIHE